jgi:hypothetical protein
VPRTIGTACSSRGLLRSDATLAEFSKDLGAAPLLSSAKARLYWFFCRLSVAESRRVLIAPFIPLRGPFGPSLPTQLLRPLLTSATGSETISRLSVSNSRPVADLPR